MVEPVVSSPTSLEAAVWWVSSATDAETILGSGFFLAPGRFVTCAHVAAGSEALVLRQADIRLDVPLSGIELAPDHASLDLALLEPIGGPDPLLASSREDSVAKVLYSRGYSRGAPQGRSSELLPRGPIQAEYTSDVNYRITGALELAGDMAVKGYSGSPLLAPDQAAVVGVICGGDSHQGRTWSIPFRLVRERFPAIEEALAWNAQHLPAFGTGLNRAGLERLWSAASGESVIRMREVKNLVERQMVRRKDLCRQIHAFLDSSFPVCAIVGESGTGKSWFLTDLANSTLAQKGLIVAAADLRRADPVPLADLVVEQLTVQAKQLSQAITPMTRPQIENLLRSRPQPMIIFIDGLNEASDVRGFIDRWFPEAVRWCRSQNVKLISSSRPEIWPTVVRAIDDPCRDLFMLKRDHETGNRNQPQQEGSGGGDERRIAIGGFSVREAEAARHAYDLPEHLDGMLRGHPLRYRLATRLGIGSQDATRGAVALIDNYVDALLVEQFARIGHLSPTLLREGLVAIAGLAQRTSDLAVDWEQARTLVGDVRDLDAYLASGLLKKFKRQLRFEHDDLVGALARVTVSPSALFKSAVMADPDEQRRHGEMLLRLEADGCQADFELALANLLGALAQLQAEPLSKSPPIEIRGHWLFALRATIVARALPSVRFDAINAIYGQLVSVAAIAVESDRLDEFASWFESSPLPAARRAELLLEISPWSNAWPLRLKDWVEEGRRSHFERALRGSYPSPVAAALNRLCRDFSAEVIPVLAAHLDDDRRIDRGESDDSRGESYVATLAAGILFNNRHGRLEQLIDIACNHWVGRSPDLASTLILSQSNASCIELLRRLPQSPHPGRLIWLLSFCIDRISAELSAQVMQVLRSLPPLSGKAEISCADLLRRLDSGDVDAWDRLAAAVERGEAEVNLIPIPIGRFARALEVAEYRPKDSLSWFAAHSGSQDEQVQLAQRVRKWLDSGAVNDLDVARLVEHKMYAVEKRAADPNLPWLLLAETIIERRNERARECLIFPLIWDISVPLVSELQRIEDQILSSGLQPGEFSVYMRGLLEMNPPWESSAWRQRTRQIRTYDYETWDIHALVKYRDDDIAQKQLLDYWRDLDSSARGWIADEVLSAADAGTELAVLFDLKRTMSLTPRQAERLRRSATAE
jgi:hypothetical protein